MRLLLFFSYFILFPGVLLFPGCETVTEEAEIVPDIYFKPGASDVLTTSELNAIILNAQRFVSESSGVKLRQEQRMIIRNTHPQTEIIYTARKYGRLSLRWDVGHGIFVQLTARGRLDVRRPEWKLEKVYSTTTSETSVPEAARELE